MRKSISEDLQLFFTGGFPAVLQTKCYNNLAILGIGGNIGNVKRRFKKLLLFLKSNPKIRPIATAPILKNPPFGYMEQADFYNSIIAVDTTFSPQELLHYALYIEKRFKRERTFKNAPRTLDVDIIFFEDKIVNKKDLFIPHPFWSERESVIIPLKFLLEFR
ncbi:2-amino-4-hydroxy-6-hydroxymethyldihydropteridine diphosphokinase [Nitratiruptor tergarcus]|uniref:2-amino-4-hydroxy-6-hydroxymethyldihydropteridine pyrophosphokinase n=1 Tax=Nitratiruptor tergarcus DSM 16512 TaxID=1069081 RepID=A0A1W1WST7_9BACT|nr:2-amino-4-hydroxy-6-hydroxymethyldihydropteridine diphosphokinase [Nitratiruptor tergarcus]SMC09110.1 2-amino-4-hydroxy-6-hydroxymethyldihydropteridinediphosphokinase [Nitratiruptor tergarcus DSM 16512]